MQDLDFIVAYVASRDLAKISSLLPSNKNRSLIVHSLINSLGLLSGAEGANQAHIHVVKPTPADYRVLSIYHSRDFLDFVLDPGNCQETIDQVNHGEFGLEDDCPPFIGLPDYIRYVAGATLTAANQLREGHAQIAICWDGGRHHAQKSRASGYCYVADCVLAILALRRPVLYASLADDGNLYARPREAMQKPKVMYLDLDLHFSDGVYQAFQSSPSATFLHLSIHHASPGFFPASSLSDLPNVSSPDFDPFILSLPLQRGASDATFARVWNVVERTKDIFSPDYLIVQCGVDGLAGDPCGVWNWSLGDGEGSLGWCVERIVQAWRCKTLVLGGGGYNSPNVARAWAYLTSVTRGNPLPLHTEIPDHSAFPLYAPSFTLDIPAGNMQDLNTDAYLQEVEACFREVGGILADRLK